jgi:hypothetical protein
MTNLHDGAMGTLVGSPASATMQGSTWSWRENKAATHDELTRWCSSARVAPQKLAVAVGFVLHSGSVCGGSKGSPVTKRPQAGVVASPWARRGLWFARNLVELELKSGLGFFACGWKSQWQRPLFIGLLVLAHRGQRFYSFYLEDGSKLW